MANFPSTVSRELSIEGLAELNRLSSVLAREQGASTRAGYLRRARRLLIASGLIGPLADVERNLDTNELDDGMVRSDLPDDPASILESVALMLSLGNHPRALGAELQSVLRSLGSYDQAELKEESAASTETPGERFDLPAQTIALGSQDGKRYSLSFRSDLALRRPAALVAIEQIVRVSLGASVVAGREDEVALWPQESTATDLGLIVGAESMRELVSTSRKLAPSNINVLITGETGTGKELLARALHDASPRSEKPFMPFNCSAVARDMLDAQLFGYRKGAFTGANDAFQGVIRGRRRRHALPRRDRRDHD